MEGERFARHAFAAAFVASLSLVLYGTLGDAQVIKHVKIVSSLPMRGASTAETQAIVNGFRMAFDELGTTFGDIAIDYEPLDDGDAAGSWQTAAEMSDAQNAAADPSVVAYLGPYNSGAAQISIPILCKAGLVMVSPSNTYPGLTKPGTGTANEPFAYYPACRRNYARVIPADDVQGTIGAAWAKSEGSSRAYLLYDDSVGYGKTLADAFRAKWSSLGQLEVGYERVARADTYLDLAHRIVVANADVVYYGGLSSNNAGFIVRDLRAAGSLARFMGSERITDDLFLQQAGTAAEGAYATLEAWHWLNFTGKALDFATRYRRKFGAELGTYSIYGYDAAGAVISAVARLGARAVDRGALLTQVMATTDYPGALATWSFDGNGDTNFSTTSVERVASGAWDLRGSASAGGPGCPTGRADPPTQTVYLPNVTKTLGGPAGFQTPFIVQNTGTAGTELEFTYYRFADGGCVTRVKVPFLAPGASFAEIPNNFPALPDNSQFSAVVKSFGSTIVSVVNEHAGIGERAEALSYVGASTGATTVFLPNIVRRFFGFHTPFIIQNLGPTTTVATATFRPFGGGPALTVIRAIASGQSQFVEPNIEPGLADGAQYAVTVTSAQPVAVVVNSHNDDPSSARPVAYATNGITAGAAAVYGPYAAKNADDQGFAGTVTTIVVQNLGTASVAPALTFTPLGGGPPTAFTGPMTAAGAAWAFDPRFQNGVAASALCGAAATAGCLADGEYSFVASAAQGTIAAAVNVLSPSTAMGYTALAQPAAKYFLPNVTRTFGGWTTPIMLQTVTATGASLEWRRFIDGALVKTQSLTIPSGSGVRVDPRSVAGLSDFTQYAVTITGTGGAVVAIVTELNLLAGDGAMAYEGFAAP